MHVTLMVTITKDEKLYVDGDESVDDATLMKKAETVKANDPEARVVIRADRQASWGKVVLTLDALKRVGLTRFGFAVEAESRNP